MAGIWNGSVMTWMYVFALFLLLTSIILLFLGSYDVPISDYMNWNKLKDSSRTKTTTIIAMGVGAVSLIFIVVYFFGNLNQQTALHRKGKNDEIVVVTPITPPIEQPDVYVVEDDEPASTESTVFVPVISGTRGKNMQRRTLPPRRCRPERVITSKP
jgi:hypothetical protein